MRKFFGIIAFCTVLFPHIVAGQYGSSQEKPAWVNGYFHEADNSYVESVTANGSTEDEARNKAAAVAIERRSLSTGKRVQVQVQNGNIVVEGKDELTVKARVLDEYREHYAPGEYRISLLIQTAKNPTIEFDRVNVTNEYGFSLRAFVPGMAQFHKGSTLKGGLIVGGEIALIGGIIITESLRASNISKINTTHNAADKQNYINNADSYETMRNVMIGGAVALYVYNVIDAIATKGKKHVVFGNNTISVSPFVLPSAGGMSGGLALSFNF
jgi:hypothetical protein